jgi:hypothetical protein
MLKKIDWTEVKPNHRAGLAIYGLTAMKPFTCARFDQRYVRQSSFLFAGAAFLFAAMRMLMLPVA